MPRPLRFLATFLGSLAAPCLLLVFSVSNLAAQTVDTPTLNLWPGVPPGDESIEPAPGGSTLAPSQNDDVIRIGKVTTPTLTLYRPRADLVNGCAVIVCPGGGYSILAWDLEGTEIAEWLNSFGVTAIILKYRVPRRDPQAPYRAPLQDLQRAIRLVRTHAEEWKIDPARVGVLGFSAGGHLSVMSATHSDEKTYPAIDGADQTDCRPNFVLPIYPAYLADEKQPGALDPLIAVKSTTPPMFLTVTSDDELRGYNAALLYQELRRAKVPAEIHVFTRGGHGYGLRKPKLPIGQWPSLCEAWLRDQGWLAATTSSGPKGEEKSATK